MNAATQISVVSFPGSEPEPAPIRRRVQRLTSTDGRAATTTVSWLTYADDVDEVHEATNVTTLYHLQLVSVSA